MLIFCHPVTPTILPNTKYHTKKCTPGKPKSNVNILSPSEPVYYQIGTKPKYRYKEMYIGVTKEQC